MNTHAVILDHEKRLAAIEAKLAQAADLSVDFASSAAAELADAIDLPESALAETEPSGETGYTVTDIRAVAKKRGRKS